MKHSKILRNFTLSTGLLSVAACSQTPAESQAESIKTQEKAVQGYVETKREVTQEVNEAQQQVHEETAEAQQEATEVLNRGQLKVAEEGAAAHARINEAKREAQGDFTKARTDLREWTQDKLNGVDSEIDKGRADAVQATAEERAQFNTIMKDVKAQREAVRVEIAALDKQTVDAWKGFKARVEDRIGKLAARVSEARRVL